MPVTPAIEAQLNERQKKMVALLVQGERLTSRRCEEDFGITRETATRDFGLLIGCAFGRSRAALATSAVSLVLAARMATDIPLHALALTVGALLTPLALTRIAPTQSHPPTSRTDPSASTATGTQ
jgi:hypothetical protein